MSEQHSMCLSVTDLFHLSMLLLKFTGVREYCHKIFCHTFRPSDSRHLDFFQLVIVIVHLETVGIKVSVMLYKARDEFTHLLCV